MEKGGGKEEVDVDLQSEEEKKQVKGEGRVGSGGKGREGR